LYSSWNNALDYSRYPRGNTAPTVLPQMHYRYRGSTVHSVLSPRYYREMLPIPTVITAVTAVLPHSPLPCHSLIHSLVNKCCNLINLQQLNIQSPFNRNHSGVDPRFPHNFCISQPAEWQIIQLQNSATRF